MNKPKVPAGRQKKKIRSVGRPRKSGNTADDNPVEEILKVASKLFSSKGYAGTTMAEIADVVGIRGPSLYYHFESKAEILRALAEFGLRDAFETGEALHAETSLTPAARFYQLIHNIVVHLRSSDYELNCLFDPVFQDSEFRDINEKINSWMKVVEGFLIDGVESDQLQIGESELTAYTIYGLITASVHELAHFKHLSPEQIASHIADFALSSMLKRKSALKTIQKELTTYRAAHS